MLIKPEGLQIKVRISRGWINATLEQANKRTVWVKIDPERSAINRKKKDIRL